MNRETAGTVVSASRQWWLKVNTKPIRKYWGDGATYPYIIQVRYTIDGTEYCKRKWIPAGKSVPAVGSQIRILYNEANPAKAKLG